MPVTYGHDFKVRPDAVLQVGGRFVSRRLLQFIEQTAPANYVLVNDSPARLDPAHRVTQKIEGDIAVVCDRLRKSIVSTNRSTCFKRWQSGNKIARRVISEKCHSSTPITEASVARYISRHLPDRSGLFLASSMPVRDMDMFADTSDNAVVVAANRGASGIDGTIASAAGFAAGLGRPVTLLIGDLACLHDLNSLALLGRSPEPITVVVLNNDGGGIFDHLPVAGLTGIFEKYFVTPHGFNFAHAAEMFDLPYFRVEDMEAFAQAYELSQQSERSLIIEVALDRKFSFDFHQSILTGMAEALESRE
jgi:2-succinyl-5-enolpyruvyl-6-hydroxy-3-cyclohexene-1-carboxylate synthase